MLEAAIAKAFSNGIERIELSVFVSNAGAVELYRKMGFKEEGTLVRKAKIEGTYHDLSLMALFHNADGRNK